MFLTSNTALPVNVNRCKGVTTFSTFTYLLIFSCLRLNTSNDSFMLGKVSFLRDLPVLLNCNRWLDATRNCCHVELDVIKLNVNILKYLDIIKTNYFSKCGSLKLVEEFGDFLQFLVPSRTVYTFESIRTIHESTNERITYTHLVTKYFARV